METKNIINLTDIRDTAIKVLTSPSEFFREMPKTGGFVEPLIFMVAMGVIGGLIHSIFSIIGLRVASGMAMGAASIILLPIVIGIFGFVGAAILFAIWKVMGSQESYETAYRCAAYISALTPITSVVGLIPYIGGVIGIALATYFIVIASIEVHKIPSQKAWLVFGIIGAILVILSFSGEIASRRVARDAIKFRQEAEKASKMMQKQAEDAAKQLQKNAEEAKKILEETQKQMKESQENKD
jgi:hypothetical protein